MTIVFFLLGDGEGKGQLYPFFLPSLSDLLHWFLFTSMIVAFF